MLGERARLIRCLLCLPFFTCFFFFSFLVRLRQGSSPLLSSSSPSWEHSCFSSAAHDRQYFSHLGHIIIIISQQWSRAALTYLLMHSQIEQHALRYFPPNLIDRAFDAGIVTAHGLLSAPNWFVTFSQYQILRLAKLSSIVEGAHLAQVFIPKKLWSRLLPALKKTCQPNIDSSSCLQELLTSLLKLLRSFVLHCLLNFLMR